jgi:lipoyl synthase
MTVLIDQKPRPRHPEKMANASIPAPPRPDWLRVRAPSSDVFDQTRGIVRAQRLTTVCDEAACPNIGACWSQKHARVLVLQRRDR